MVKSRYIGDGHPTFNRNPYNGYMNPYYWVDDHPLLYGNNGSLDPGTYIQHSFPKIGGFIKLPASILLVLCQNHGRFAHSSTMGRAFHSATTQQGPNHQNVVEWNGKHGT